MKLIEWKLQEVTLSELDWDDTQFDWNSRLFDQKSSLQNRQLKDSLATYGLLMPLVIQAKEPQGFRIIDGFQRAHFLREMVKGENPDLTNPFPCLVIPEANSKEEVAFWKLQTMPLVENFTGQQIGWFLQRLIDLRVTEEQIVDEVLPKLGVKSSKEVCQGLLRVTAVLGGASYKVVEGLSVDDILLLLKFSDTEIREMLKVLQGLVLGGNKWKSLMQLFYDVPRVTNQPLIKILNSSEVVRILHSPEIQPPIQFKRLKQQLEQWRYPELMSARRDFEQAVQQLPLSKSIQVEYDSNFERDTLSLKIEVDSLNNLSEQLENLPVASHAEVWQKLFELVHGE